MTASSRTRVYVLALLVAAWLPVWTGCAGSDETEAPPSMVAVFPELTVSPEDQAAEADARLSYLRAEGVVTPATQVVFDEGVSLYDNGQYAAAGQLFQEVIRQTAPEGQPPPEQPPAEAATDVAPPAEVTTDVAPPAEVTTDVAPPVEAATDVAPPVEAATDVAPPVEARSWGLYRVAPGDVLDIDVYGRTEFSRTGVIVRPDGCIMYYMIGEMAAAGKTIPELAAELTQALSIYVKNPKVTIFPSHLGGGQVILMGGITGPGVYPVDKGMRLRDLLARAGGLQEVNGRVVADLKRAFLSRGGRIVPTDFERVMAGDEGANIAICPGDFVFVPLLVTETADYVTVLGAVARSGNLAYHAGMTLKEAIAVAGGFPSGNAEDVDFRGAYVARGQRVLPVDFYALFVGGDLTQDVALKSGDYVFLPAARGKRVYVLGEVGRPGVVSVGADVTFVHAVAASGGLTMNGRRGAVYLVRGSLTKPQTFRVDAMAILEGEATDFPLERNDIIYVSPTVLTSWNHLLSQIMPTINAANSVKRLGD